MSKEPEVQIKTSMKNAGAFIKVALSALGAMGLGAAGSVLTSSSDANAQDERMSKLESACSGYNVRLTATETKLQNYEYNLIEMRKDLAEIRSTNTQILFLLQKDRNK